MTTIAPAAADTLPKTIDQVLVRLNGIIVAPVVSWIHAAESTDIRYNIQVVAE